jgi:hypothetical protein
MCPTKDRKLRTSGTDERVDTRKEQNLCEDSVPTPLGFSALMPIPELCLPLGLSSALGPSLVLAPESALGLLPSSALSSAPAARSVSPRVVLRKMGMKKGLIIAALSDMCVNASELVVGTHFL